MPERRSILPGLLLILLGVLALLRSSGASWASMDRLWPILVFALGLGSLVNGLSHAPRDSGAIWFGIMAIFAGALFGYITLGAGEWRDMAWLWPAFPAVAGLAWIAVWALDVRNISSIVTGLIALFVGGIGFLYTMGRISATLVATLVRWSPLILILIGIALVIQFAIRRHE